MMLPRRPDFMSRTAVPAVLTESVIGRLYGCFTGHDSTSGIRLLLILALAIIAHLMVRIIRHVSEWLILRSHAKENPFGFMTEKPKFITVTRLIVSAVIFTIYFLALGLALEEFNVNLTAYLASASVIGLAISFGSQGLIQDIVIGLTLIFWDAMDVGDLVEIYASTTIIGRVQEIGMRFTRSRMFSTRRSYVPNRTIANVSRFPRRRRRRSTPTSRFPRTLTSRKPPSSPATRPAACGRSLVRSF